MIILNRFLIDLIESRSLLTRTKMEDKKKPVDVTNISDVKFKTPVREETSKGWTQSPYQTYQNLKSGSGLSLFQNLPKNSKLIMFNKFYPK